MINATGNRMAFEIARQTRLARSIEGIQIDISTGKRIQRPSDDPAASARVATIRQSQANDDVWKRNIDLGSSLAAQADGVLKGLNERLARAQVLTIQGSTGSLPQGDRDTIAAEIRGIAEEIDGLAATQSSLGQPLFSAGTPRAIRFGDSVLFAPVPCSSDVFEYSSVSLSNQLRNVAAAVQSGSRAQLDGALDLAQGLVRHGADVAAGIGSTAARLDLLADTRASRAVDLTVERTSLEGTDYTSAIATLNAQQLTLDAAQAAFARINRRSLIDLLS
jgi:flagellar hook-associated protein 3 FlgL